MGELGRVLLLAATEPPAVAIASIALFLSVSSLIAWGWIAERWRLGQPTLPYQPRRRVPWGAVDLAVILAVYIAALAWTMQAGEWMLGPEGESSRGALGTDVSHPVAQLLAEGQLWMLLLAAFSAIVVAPLFEEFLFRVVLQGWLEALQRRERRRIPTLRRLVPWGVGPILLSSLLFARMHFRVEGPAMSTRYLIMLLASNATAGLATLGFGLAWLRVHRRASLRDLGFDASKFASDVGVGLTTFLAFAAPIYALQMYLSWLLPAYIAADPLSLLLLAVVLGTLYFRTHRIVPSVVVHTALNATSVAIGWLTLAR